MSVEEAASAGELDVVVDETGVIDETDAIPAGTTEEVVDAAMLVCANAELGPTSGNTGITETTTAAKPPQQRSCRALIFLPGKFEIDFNIPPSSILIRRWGGTVTDQPM